MNGTQTTTKKEKMTDLEALLYGFYMDDVTVNAETYLEDACNRIERTTEDNAELFTVKETFARWDAYRIIEAARFELMADYCKHLNSFRTMALELESKRRY